MSSILVRTVTFTVCTQQISSFHLGRDTSNYDRSACYILLLPQANVKIVSQIRPKVLAEIFPNHNSLLFKRMASHH